MRGARAMALLVATGAIAFELVEWRTIGFQPLEAILTALELLMVALAWRLRAADPAHGRGEDPR